MNIINLLLLISSLSLTLPLENIISPSIQKQNVFSLDNFYLIEQAILDSVDYSEHYRSVQGFIKFYRPASNENIHMANVMEKSGTQSYGEITGVTEDTLTINNKTIDIVYFDWHYSNSYDDVSGVAKIVFYTTITNGYDEFVCIMFLEDDEYSVFSGPIINNETQKEIKSLPVLKD